ncbi:DUF2510 domain-containing protein [Streptomyces sp. NPDC048361]|uniref:DUF2510 domain-containing protein n=1 Tax=Streptomyces sp. NPDC048361 TaxID=3154720 RepID=UPI0034201AB1
MTMTTPPGWYPDPGLPGTERWWDGAAWTANTRTHGAPAFGPPQPVAVVVPPPARRRGRTAAIGAAAVVLVAGAVGGAVLLGRGDDDPSPTSASDSASAPVAADSPSTQASSSPTGNPNTLVDQLNGITLPIPEGWEKTDDPVSGLLTMTTKDTYDCPGGSGFCHHGTVTTSTATATDLKTPEAVAKNDITDAANDAYDHDLVGSRPYNGITAHHEVKSGSVVVDGRTGYLVRWQVTTGSGPGGYVESLAFPSTVGSQAMVIARFAFDTGADGPPLALMDTITRGIAPIGGGGGQNGGAGTSLAPPSL